MIESVFNCSSITIQQCSFDAPHDRSQLEFHILSDDYFPYLSSLLSFVEETLGEKASSDEFIRIQADAIRATRKDLQYLHDHFRIEARP